MIVQDIVFDADAPSSFTCLGTATSGERTTTLGLVTGISIGHRNKLDLVAQRGILGGEAASPNIAIVWMRAEGDHAHFRILLCECGRQQEQNQYPEHMRRSVV